MHHLIKRSMHHSFSNTQDTSFSHTATKCIQRLLRRRAPVVGSDALQISNDPKRRKLGAMRDTTEQRSMTGCPVYSRSRSTRSSLVTTLPARVVGMPCRVYGQVWDARSP